MPVRGGRAELGASPAPSLDWDPASYQHIRVSLFAEWPDLAPAVGGGRGDD